MRLIGLKLLASKGLWERFVGHPLASEKSWEFGGIGRDRTYDQDVMSVLL